MPEIIATIERVESHEVELEAFAMLREARAIVVCDLATATYAETLLLRVVSVKRAAVALFAPMKETVNAARAAVYAGANTLLLPLEETETVLKRKVLDHEQEEMRDAMARSRLAEAAARARDEEERLALAEQAEAAGDAAGAEALLSADVFVPPPVRIEARTPGVSIRQNWKARVADKHALIRFVAANPGFVGLLDVNMPAANAQARSLKGAMDIPGLQAYNDPSLAVRSAP